jgi:hypothetical protein
MRRRFMDVLDTKTEKDLLDTLIPEIAKAANELRCAKKDLEKVNGRISFLLVLANELINRQEIKR